MLSDDVWGRLIDGQTFAKQGKCYQPKYPRSEDGGDDPLYHRKFEVASALKLQDGTVP